MPPIRKKAPPAGGAFLFSWVPWGKTPPEFYGGVFRFKGFAEQNAARRLLFLPVRVLSEEISAGSGIKKVHNSPGEGNENLFADSESFLIGFG